MVGARWRSVFVRVRRKLADGVRSPWGTLCEAADYFKHRAILAQFPVLVTDHGLQPISLDVPSEFSSCNPSIIDHPAGWLAVVRTHNLYRIKAGQEINKLEDRSRLVNESWISTYTDDFRLINQAPLIIRYDVLSDAEREHSLPNGIADFRIFRMKEKYYLLGSGCNIRNRLDTMVIGRLNGNEFVIESILKSPKGSPVEKNWMPIEITGDCMRAVYSVNPLCIVEISNGLVTEIFNRQIGLEMPEYRGSSQLIKYRDGYLCVVHRVISVEWRRIYLHRLMYFQSNWELVAMSREFFIETKGIEFCAGLANRGNRYVLSYGVGDIAARAVPVPDSVLEGLLRPMDQRTGALCSA